MANPILAMVGAFTVFFISIVAMVSLVVLAVQVGTLIGNGIRKLFASK